MLQAEVGTDFFRRRAPYCLKPTGPSSCGVCRNQECTCTFSYQGFISHKHWASLKETCGKKSPEFVSSSCIEFRLTSLFPSCFLLLGFFFFKCVCLIVCGCMHAWVCARAMPAEVRRGHQPSPGVEVTGDCEPPCRCWILCKKTKCSYHLSNLCEPCAQILHTLLSSVNEFLLYRQRDF